VARTQVGVEREKVNKQKTGWRIREKETGGEEALCAGGHKGVRHKINGNKFLTSNMHSRHIDRGRREEMMVKVEERKTKRKTAAMMEKWGAQRRIVCGIQHNDGNR
jgi:hypothetical protein